MILIFLVEKLVERSSEHTMNRRGFLNGLVTGKKASAAQQTYAQHTRGRFFAESVRGSNGKSALLHFPRRAAAGRFAGGRTVNIGPYEPVVVL
jgi:hypothetical protein